MVGLTTYDLLSNPGHLGSNAFRLKSQRSKKFNFLGFLHSCAKRGTRHPQVRSPKAYDVIFFWHLSYYIKMEKALRYVEAIATIFFIAVSDKPCFICM